MELASKWAGGAQSERGGTTTNLTPVLAGAEDAGIGIVVEGEDSQRWIYFFSSDGEKTEAPVLTG